MTMSIGLAVLLGLVQGLTEFLPISSSGHLALTQALFGGDVEADYMLFNVLLHFGTLLSVCIAFRKDIKELFFEFLSMCKDGFKVHKKPYRRFIVMLIFSMLPMLLVLPVKSKLEDIFSSTLAVGIFLLCTAALLYLSDRMPKGRKTEKSASYLDALVVGLAQCFAVLPGVSRSGSTMVAGLSRGFSKDFSVRFAFIMSIPVILGANILEVGEALVTPPATPTPIYIYVIGIAVALFSGLLAIRMVKLITSRHGLRPFSYYCAGLGVITILVSVFTR